VSSVRCADCAEPLPLKRRLLGRKRCDTCETAHAAEQEAERQRLHREHEAAVAEYREVVGQLAPGVDLHRLARRVDAAREATPLQAEEVERLEAEALSELIELVKTDGVVSSAEDAFVAEAVKKLGLRWLPEQARGYQIAALESGFVMRDPSPAIVIKRGEVAHLHIAAERLELKVEHELRWQSAGGEVPVGQEGLRAVLEGGRGKLVETSRSMQAVDRGSLSVTSQRVVFAGTAEAQEFALGQLLGVRVFSNGLGLQIANRNEVPTFRTRPGDSQLAAATALTAAQRLVGTLPQPPAIPVPTAELGELPSLLKRSGFSEETTGPESQ